MFLNIFIRTLFIYIYTNCSTYKKHTFVVKRKHPFLFKVCSMNMYYTHNQCLSNVIVEYIYIILDNASLKITIYYLSNDKSMFLNKFIIALYIYLY